MKHAEMRDFIRKTAIESVKKLLKNLPEHHAYPRDAIRMVDREIGGLLAHKESPSYNGYRDYATHLFPAGLEATLPGKDIILILNNRAVTVMKDGQERSINIPSSLKNPEKGVAQIIGHYLARTLFIVRGKILSQLIEMDEKGAEWQVNLTANDEAQHVLKNYDPYPGAIHKLFPAKMSWFSDLFPCVLSHSDEVKQSQTSTATPN